MFYFICQGLHSNRLLETGIVYAHLCFFFVKTIQKWIKQIFFIQFSMLLYPFMLYYSAYEDLV